MHELAQSFFRQCLAGKSGEAPRSYLLGRGLSQETIDAFGLGYSLDSWQGLKNVLLRQGYTAEQGVQAGLLSQNKQGRVYDRFRGRIIFPIFDLGGRVAAFGGRTIGDGEPKYLNSSDTPIFKKGDLLYGLYQARQNITQSKEALLTEGYSDVLTLVQSGFGNACGVLGTALTSTQVKRLSGLCRKVTLIFDGDRAGEQASLRSAAMVLQAGLSAQVVSLPQGEDVDSLLRREGAEALQALLQEAREGLAFCLSMISVYYAPREMLRWAVDFLQGLPEASWQAYYLPRIAKGLQLSEAELRQALQEPRGQRQRQEMAKALQSSSPGARDRELLRFALCYPQYISRLREHGLEEVLRTERGRIFWDKLQRHGRSDDMLPLLDEGEKRFFVECKFNPAYNVDPEQVWQDLRAFLDRSRKDKEQKELQQALSRAQQRGDTQEVFRLLEQFSRFSKGEE
jgi:DNA primase